MAGRKAPPRSPETVAEPTTTEPVDEPSFVGETPDQTPDHHYTLRGVIEGLPVPGHGKTNT